MSTGTSQENLGAFCELLGIECPEFFRDSYNSRISIYVGKTICQDWGRDGIAFIGADEEFFNLLDKNEMPYTHSNDGYGQCMSTLWR